MIEIKDKINEFIKEFIKEFIELLNSFEDALSHEIIGWDLGFLVSLKLKETYSSVILLYVEYIIQNLNF